MTQHKRIYPHAPGHEVPRDVKRPGEQQGIILLVRGACQRGAVGCCVGARLAHVHSFISLRQSGVMPGAALAVNILVQPNGR